MSAKIHLLENLKNTVNRYNMLDKIGEKIIIAVSGGADSVSLLYAFFLLKNEFDINLSACHINHNLRKEESLRDEDFVREFCEKLNVSLDVFSVNILEKIKKHQSLEECAREVRYSYFDKLCVNSKIATAHNADDNIETIIINLTRGTGLKGLCGIPPVRKKIIRPLINCSRAEIEVFIKENNLSYVSDSSNFSDNYTRNKIRNKVIPVLRDINPSLARNISKMCVNLREDEKFFNEIAQETFSAAYNEDLNCFDVKLILSEREPVLRRIISLILTKNNTSPSYLRITGIEKIMIHGHGKINLEKNKFAVVSNKNNKNFLSVKIINQNYRENRRF